MAIDLVSCLKSFVTVAEYESFTQAARQMYLSTSVVTKQIQNLESELGVVLFTRTTRQLSLTPSGEIYLKEANEILDKIKNAYNTIHSISTEPQGNIKVAIPGFAQVGIVLSLIAKFLEQYPKINLNITNDQSPFQLYNKTMDIVISETKTNTPQLTHHQLMQVKKSVFASPNYLKKYGIPKTPDDLKKHNCLINQVVTPTNEWIFANNTRVKVSGNYTLLAGVSLVPAAVLGIGLIWTPNFLVEQEIKNGELVLVDIEPGPSIVPIYLYHSPITYSGLIKLFIDWIKKETTLQFVNEL